MDVNIPDRLNADSQRVVPGNLTLPRRSEARRALAETWELELCQLDTKLMEGGWPILPSACAANSLQIFILCQYCQEQPHLNSHFMGKSLTK